MPENGITYTIYIDGPLGTSARNKYGHYGSEIYDEKNPLKAFFETQEEESDVDEDPEKITIGTSMTMSFDPNSKRINGIISEIQL